MAVSTILRSIAFSRATASAICNSSSLLALTVAMSVSLVLRRPPYISRRGIEFGFAALAVAAFAAALFLFAPPQRLGNQRIGQHEPRFGHVVDAQQNVGRLGSRGRVAQPCAFAFGAVEFAAKAAAALDRRRHLDMRKMPGIAVEIGAPHQRPVDAGR